MRAHDPRLSAALHDSDGPRPYTTGDVVGLGPIRENRRQLSPERSGWLRITTLNEALTALLHERILPMLPGAFIDLDGATLRIESASTTPDEHMWAGQASAQQLVSAGALSGNMPRNLTLRFASPTTFKSQGVNVPFPMPDLVFGSLLMRWNAFAPVTLHPNAKQFAEVQVVASRYNLKTRYITFSQGKHGSAVGCVGQCRYTVRGNDRYWRGVMRTLAHAAFFVGVGARTAIGMGQTALWDNESLCPVRLGNGE
ncbi:MAG: CRISPR-associated endoribonuclease Cas6 [Gammaproteobacteria bacterium]|nr:CRISPR-associated endoribonuclease Cas6 [Gammaproteobacteria bacterium]